MIEINSLPYMLKGDAYTEFNIIITTQYFHTISSISIVFLELANGSIKMLGTLPVKISSNLGTAGYYSII